MKTLTKTVVAACMVVLAWAQPTTDVLVVHNVADVVGVSSPVVLDSIDVYLSLDGGANWSPSPVIADFKFREARRITLPTGPINLWLGIAPGNSTGPLPIILSYAVPPLPSDTFNIAVIAGTINLSTSSANIDIKYYLNAIDVSPLPSAFVFYLFHGAPELDTLAFYLGIQNRLLSPYEPDTLLAKYSYYPDLLGASMPEWLILDTSYANPNNIFPIAYGIPDPALTGLAGQAGVIFTSGDTNSPDPNKAFGIYVALASGIVRPLLTEEVRRLQVVHNAADPALAAIDMHAGAVGPNPIPVNFLDGFPTDFAVGSTGATDTFLVTGRGGTTVLDSAYVTLPPSGGNYLLLFQGVVNPALFAANPNSASIGFETVTIPTEGWAQATSFRATLFHGVTDAPAVDLYAGSSALATNLSYKAHAGPLSLPAGAPALIEVRPASQTTPVATFRLDATQARAGEGAVIFASGFLNPASNQNGPAFRLYIIYVDGNVEPLDLQTNIAGTSPLQSLSVASNPSGTGVWTVYLGTDRAAELPYTLSTPAGQAVRQGTWSVPSNGAWGYTLSAEELPSGLYILQVGGQTLRLVRL